MPRLSQGQILSDALDHVRAHPRYGEICEIARDYYGEHASNPLKIVADAVSENSYTRLLRYLFDSQATHDLRCRFYIAWAAAIGLPAAWYRNPNLVRATTQWRTRSGRYVDLVLAVRTAAGDWYIVAIENKHWTDESEDQLRDYQEGIDSYHREARGRMLVFLTPDGRSSQTGEHDHATVGLLDRGYETIRTAIRDCLPDAGAVGDFLRHLDDYTATHLIPQGGLMTKAQELMQDLLKDPETKRAVDLIRAAYPETRTTRSLFYEHVLDRIRESYPLASVAWYHPNELNPWEININLGLKTRGAIARDGGEVLLMSLVRSDDPKPGDTVNIYLMCFQKDMEVKAATRDAYREKWKSQLSALPPNHCDPNEWHRWICLWSGRTCHLEDMDDGDAHLLADRLLEAAKIAVDHLLMES